MGLMGTLREGTHVILWILLVTFVGSLAIGGLVGGADIIDYIMYRYVILLKFTSIKPKITCIYYIHV